MSPREQSARDFASHWHTISGKLRKYTGEPYIVHPAAVVAIVRGVPHTEAMLCAGWLHDVVDDTPCTLADVEQHFGAEVAEMVSMLSAVSSPTDGNRAVRTALERAHAAKSSPDAKTVRLADVITNIDTIVEHDPEFARVYVPEKWLLLDVLREGDAELWVRARDGVWKAMQELGLAGLACTDEQ